MALYLRWPYISVYVSCPDMIINNIPFYSQKWPDLDSELYNHHNTASFMDVYECPYILYTCLVLKIIFKNI